MLKNLKNNKKKRGFTLIELIIVIAIIAILAVLAIPKFGEVKKDANFKSDIADGKTIANAAASLLANGQTLGSTVYVDNTKTTGNLIEENLENPPKPKSTGYKEYEVTIDSSQNITVKMTDATGGSGGTKTTILFPIPATSAQ